MLKKKLGQLNKIESPNSHKFLDVELVHYMKAWTYNFSMNKMDNIKLRSKNFRPMLWTKNWSSEAKII